MFRSGAFLSPLEELKQSVPRRFPPHALTHLPSRHGKPRSGKKRITLMTVVELSQAPFSFFLHTSHLYITCNIYLGRLRDTQSQSR